MKEAQRQNRGLEEFVAVLYALVLTFSFAAFEGVRLLSPQFILALAIVLITVENYLTNYQYADGRRTDAFDASLVVFNLIHLVFAYKCMDVLATGRTSELQEPTFWVAAILIYVNSFLHSIRTRQRPFWRLTMLRAFVILLLIAGYGIFAGWFGPHLGESHYLLYCFVVLCLAIIVVIPRAFNRGIHMTYATDVEVECMGSARELPRDWDALVDEHSWALNPRYLEAVESARAVDGEFVYFGFRQNQKLVGIAAGLLLTNDFVMFSGDRLRAVVRAIRHAWPSFLLLRTFEIGSPLAMSRGIACDPSITDDALYEMLDHLKLFANDRGAPLLLVRDFIGGEETRIEKALRRLGYASANNMPVGLLRLKWTSIDEYLASMRGRYRKTVHRKQRRMNLKGIDVRIRDEMPDERTLREYVRLYQNVAGKASQNTREHIGEDYHRAMYAALPGNSYWLEYWDGDVLICFIHFVVVGELLVSMFVGMDYQKSKASYAYFNSYFHLVEFGIKNGLRQVNVGITAYETKSEYGFSIAHCRFLVFHRNAMLKHGIARVFELVTDYDTKRTHYVFNQRGFQTIWRGPEQ